MKYLFLKTLLFLGTWFYSQSPNWSVNTSSYQHKMTISAFLNVDGNTLTNINGKIKVFVGNESIGEANVLYHVKADKFIVYLTVYSNTFVGENINFKLYNSVEDKIIDVGKTEFFERDKVLGSIFQSYSIASPALKSTAVLKNFSFKDIESINNSIVDNKVSVKLPQDADITNLTPVFLTDDNAIVFHIKKRQVTGVDALDFSEDVIFEVLSEDNSVVEVYTVKVSRAGALSVSSEFDIYEDKPNVFPNPLAGDKLYVKVNNRSNAIVQILVFDMRGKIISDKKVNSSLVELNFSNYSKGLYFLKIIKENASFIVKRIIRS